jgi:transcriptional regulator with XRE-family HTH domain
MVASRLSARAFFAREIRRARETKGMTQKDAANALYVSEQYIGHWETGRRIPPLDCAGRLDRLHDTGGFFTRLLEDLVSAEVEPQWFGKWPVIEKQAATLWSFQPTVVDGLLQTEEYARAVLQAGRYHLTDVDDMVTSRLRRQHILTEGDDPPILVVVMAESVIRQRVGDATVMGGQLRHLAAMAERRTIVVQIVPFTAPEGAGFLSPFILASLEGGAQVGYVDHQLSGEVIERADEVAAIRRMFELFRAAALSAAESLRLIRKAAAQWAS